MLRENKNQGLFPVSVVLLLFLLPLLLLLLLLSYETVLLYSRGWPGTLPSFLASWVLGWQAWLRLTSFTVFSIYGIVLAAKVGCAWVCLAWASGKPKEGVYSRGSWWRCRFYSGRWSCPLQPVHRWLQGQTYRLHSSNQSVNEKKAKAPSEGESWSWVWWHTYRCTRVWGAVGRSIKM